MGDWNVVSRFVETAKTLNSNPCFHYKYGGEWKTLNWSEVKDLVYQYARGLKAIGVGKGTPVAIFSATRMEWTLADMAILAAGGVTVPVYPNLPLEHIEFILKDSGTKIVLVENDAMLAQLETIGGGLKNFDKVILIEGVGKPDSVSTLRALMELGSQCPTEKIDESISAISLEDPASYIYTSGTTGIQKGVVVSHRNMRAEIEGVFKIFGFNSHEVCLVCLPLAHVLGRMAQFYLLCKGCQSGYAESIEKLAQNYREIKPHFVVGVPRMLEKAMERIETVVNQGGGLKRKIFFWAKGVAMEVGGKIEKREKISGWLGIRYAIAKKLVFDKLIQRMGGRLYCFVSGGAPLSKDVAKFFTAAGVCIVEGYGLTETFAAMTVNHLDNFRFGTVGQPLEGVDIKIASDGEILVRGPIVFKKYLNRPDATEEAFDDGWFKTGDIGDFTEGGFLRITDRKKDIIVTAGGKNIAPQRIEAMLTESPFINHVMVYGDKKKYLTALITVNLDALMEYARQEGIVYSEPHELIENPLVYKLIEKIVEEKNSKLASFETVKRFVISPEDFSTETGEITPTLKIRRKHVIKKYGDLLEGLYRD